MSAECRLNRPFVRLVLDRVIQRRAIYGTTYGTNAFSLAPYHSDQKPGLTSIGLQPVSFIHRSEVANRASVRRIVPTGRINVSAPEVTVLDLVEAPNLGGGLSNVATVIAQLLESNQLDTAALTEEAANYSTAVAQRGSHVIDQMGNATDIPIDLQPLREQVVGAQVVDLYPGAERTGERDRRWNVAVNIEIEPDL